MDALALLCTLHADGPATLKRLRQVGCSTLEHIESLELERLGELIGAAPAAARRFAREAKSLRERVGGSWLEREDATASERASVAIAPHGVPVTPVESGDAPALSLGDVALVQRVLSVWRERDQVEPLAPLADAPTPVISTAPHARASAQRSSAPAPSLVPGQVDGLDESLCQRLAEHGIDSLDALAQADTLALAKTLDLGFTRVSRLQFLCARALGRSGSAGERVVQRSASAKLSPSETPLRALAPAIDLEPVLDLPRSPLPSAGRAAPARASASERAAPSRTAAAEREAAGGPFV